MNDIIKKLLPLIIVLFSLACQEKRLVKKVSTKYDLIAGKNIYLGTKKRELNKITELEKVTLDGFTYYSSIDTSILDNGKNPIYNDFHMNNNILIAHYCKFEINDSLTAYSLFKKYLNDTSLTYTMMTPSASHFNSKQGFYHGVVSYSPYQGKPKYIFNIEFSYKDSYYR